MKQIMISIMLISLLLSSCIEQPNAPENHTPPAVVHGTYILCEGIWGMDNASLDRFDFSSNSVTKNIFQSANEGQRLGDLASDFVVWKNFALISVTTTRTIEKIDLKSGKSLGRISFGSKRAPRKIAVANDSLAAVSDLYNHWITFFNPSTLKIIRDSIEAGPAPEGIAFADDVLLVVNSGFGDYLANKPKAGTVSVISIQSMREIGNFHIGNNPIEILVNKKYNKFYVSYNNLPSLSDSVGGIVEFDLTNLHETARTKTNVRSLTLSPTADTLFFIADSTISYIPLNMNFEEHTLINNPNPSDIWYSLACSPKSEIFIGNARNYQISGQLLIYKNGKYDTPSATYSTGINPNKIVFY